MLFTHSATFSTRAPPGGLSSVAPNISSGSPPGSSSRGSRLRRLSHLRSYNPSHLLSRDGSSGSSGSGSGSVGEILTRSSSEVSGTTPRSTQPASNGTRNKRLTLVSSAPTMPRAPGAGVGGSLANSPTAVNLNAAPEEPPSPPPANPEASQAASAAAAGPDANGDGSNAEAGPATQNTDRPVLIRQRASTTGESSAAAPAASAANDMLPSLRLSAYYDPRSTRPSLSFPPISRTLPTATESIRVGRYSERDNQGMSNMPNNQPSAAPVGFKSKVVSRRHCEFWFENGKWYIKDVKSSSGTFLNHIRLSPASQESKAFPVNDGDIVQLGIDFKGGEEMIFRCVKMRIELNRGWQNKLNTFNVAAHKRLRTMASSTPAGSSGNSSQDCSICLNSIAPCQSLFVAPCSHTWHFRCVRSLLTSPQYPIFICPNCRAGADLEADVDDPADDWEQLGAEGEIGDKTSVGVAGTNASGDADINPQANTSGPRASQAMPLSARRSSEQEDSTAQDSDIMDLTRLAISADERSGSRNQLTYAASEPVLIRNSPTVTGGIGMDPALPTPSPPANGDGPTTPFNEVGPWVLDGGAGQTGPRVSQAGLASLDAAADMVLSGDSSDASMR